MLPAPPAATGNAAERSAAPSATRSTPLPSCSSRPAGVVPDRVALGEQSRSAGGIAPAQAHPLVALPGAPLDLGFDVEAYTAAAVQPAIRERPSVLGRARNHHPERRSCSRVTRCSSPSTTSVNDDAAGERAEGEHGPPDPRRPRSGTTATEPPPATSWGCRRAPGWDCTPDRGSLPGLPWLRAC